MLRSLLIALAVVNFWTSAPGAGQQVVGTSPQGGVPQAVSGGPPPPVPTGAISGTVIDGATHRPVPGAIVFLRLNTGAPLARITRQLTDPDGRFVFRALAPSDGYILTASKFGYLDGGYGQTTMLSANGRIALTDGQWVSDAKVVMWKPGAISGTVVDEFGEAVVGAFVRVIAEQVIGGQLQLVAGPVTKTDDRGEYRISGLTPGKYLVNVPSVQHSVPAGTPNLGGPDVPASQLATRLLLGVALPPRTDAAIDLDPSHRLLVGNYVTPPPATDGHARAYPIAFYPNAVAVSSATAVELTTSEDRRGIDFQLQPVPTARVLGQVDGPPGAANGMLLRLMPAGLEDLGSGSEAATTLVASDGTFGFLNVPAGSYTVEARRSTMEFVFQTSGGGLSLPTTPGLTFSSSSSGTIPSAPPGTGYSAKSSQGGDAYWGRTKVAVDAGDVSNVVVTLRKSVTVYGQFAFEGNTSAPAFMPVFAEPANASPSLGMPHSPFPREDDDPSEFTIEGLQPGEYILRCQTPATWTVKSITIGGEDFTRKPLDASSGHDLANVVVTLTDKTVKLRGVVQNDQGVVSDAAVIAFPVEREQWSRYGFSPARIKAVPVASANGFTFDGLPAGEYYVVAVDASKINSWQDPAFLERASSVATRVSLQWGDSKTVDVKLMQIK